MARVAEQANSTQVSHTPGPWKAVFPNRGVTEMSSIYAPAMADGDEPWRVAYVLREDNPHQRRVDDANAHLIAAAPTMKAALLKAVETIKALHSLGLSERDAETAWRIYQQSPEMKVINGAIAEAEGR